jgi:hypothetical protein
VTAPLVRKVDHVLVPVADPRPLFELFTATLGLPAAWPVMQRGTFFSGAVCLGNANLEFIRGEGTVPFLVPVEPLVVRGVAFEPEADDGWAEALAERDLPFVGPTPSEGESIHGGHRLLYTIIFVPGLVDDATATFLCHYHSEEALRGEAAMDALAASRGGAIGARGLAEVTIGLSAIDDGAVRWRRFLAPIEPDGHGTFVFEHGPAVRLKRSPIDGVAGLWLEVGSLAKARDALRERDLLGPMRASGIGLNYARTGGLDVWLTEARPTR